MPIIDQLRPLEALCVLELAGKEKAVTNLDKLAAALAYLFNAGYTKLSEGGLVLTEKRHNADATLRPYEKEMLKTLNSPYNLTGVVMQRDLRPELASQGLLVPHNTKHGWWLFKWTEVTYTPTEQFDTAVKELADLKQKIKDQASAGDLQDDKQLSMMAYVFPSLPLDTKGFRAYADKMFDIASRVASNPIFGYRTP